MKAAFMVAPKTMELRDIPEPACPDDGLILNVFYCGICGSDIRRWKEGPPEGSNGVLTGHEASGVVVETGPAQNHYKIGDRIAVGPDINCGSCYYCKRGLYNLCDSIKFLGITPGYDGGFAEKMALSGHVLARGINHKIPGGLSFEHAALAEPCTSVLATQNKVNVSLGDVVVIIGAGPTGCAHAAVAKARGASVIVVQRSEKRREMAALFNPDLIVNPNEENLKESVLDFTNGVGTDIAICANPVAATATEAVSYVRKGGKVVLFGGLPKKDPSVKVDGNLIHYGEREVIGAFSYHPTFFAQALDLLNSGVIPAKHLISDTVELENVQSGFEMAASGKALKVLVNLNGE